MELFAFTGKMGVGKDHLSQIFHRIMPPLPTVIMALADHFKIDRCVKKSLKYEELFHQKTEQSRLALQEYGTRSRSKYGADIWIKILNTWIRMHMERGIKRIIVTDIRYPNEVHAWRSLGGKLFRIVAPERNHARLMQEAHDVYEVYRQLASHPSETALDDFPESWDTVLMNDPETDESVWTQLRILVRKLTSSSVPPRMVIFCDLDDTICQCVVYYRRQLNHLKEKLGPFPEEIWTELVKRHVYSFNLRPYSHDDFALSLTQIVLEGKESVQAEDLLRAYQIGMEVYQHDYSPLSPQTIPYLRSLSQLGQVLLFTMGDVIEQRVKIARLGLSDLSLEVFTHKDANMFHYLQQKYPAFYHVMIGDSLIL